MKGTFGEIVLTLVETLSAPSTIVIPVPALELSGFIIYYGASVFGVSLRLVLCCVWCFAEFGASLRLVLCCFL